MGPSLIINVGSHSGGAQGQLVDAELVFCELFEGSRETLGDQHPQTLVCLENLADVLFAPGKRTQAKRILQMVRNGRHDTLGSGHPDTVRSISYLASFYDVVGKPEKAKAVRRARDTASGGSGSASNALRQAAICANCRTREPAGDEVQFRMCTVPVAR